MKTESLHALVIDHHAGELQPEVAELLESYLVANPAAWAESTRLLSVIEVTRQTVNRHPELGRTFAPVDPTESPRVKSKAKADVMPGWLKMAAMLAFAALTALGGYWAGSDREEGGPQAVELARATPGTSRKDSPWARYRMETDQVGRIQVVRVDAEAKEGRP
jgi:hypothetical protein